MPTSRMSAYSTMRNGTRLTTLFWANLFQSAGAAAVAGASGTGTGSVTPVLDPRDMCTPQEASRSHHDDRDQNEIGDGRFPLPAEGDAGRALHRTEDDRTQC